MLSWYAMVLIYLNIILLVVTSGPIPPADTVNPCFAGLTVFLPLIVRLAPHTEPVPRCYQRIQFVNHRA